MRMEAETGLGPDSRWKKMKALRSFQEPLPEQLLAVGQSWVGGEANRHATRVEQGD